MNSTTPTLDDSEKEKNSTLEQRLQRLKLPGPLLVSRVEAGLPFGMLRRIPPPRLLPVHTEGECFDAAAKIVSMRTDASWADRSCAANPPRRLLPIPMNSIQPNIMAGELKPCPGGDDRHFFLPTKQAIAFPSFKQHKFIQTHPPSNSVTATAATAAANHQPSASVLYFDQSCLLFTRGPGQLNPTLLSSNYNGSVSGDKSHFGAILTNGCWLLPLGPSLSHPRLPLTANNKLKLIKCAEFMAREWSAEDVDVAGMGGLAVVRPEQAVLSRTPNVLTVVGRTVPVQSQSGSNVSATAVTGLTGLTATAAAATTTPVRTTTTTTTANNPSQMLFWFLCNQFDARRGFSWVDCSLPFSFTAQDGDWVVLLRSSSVPNPAFLTAMKRLLSESEITDDLEQRLMRVLPVQVTALVISRMISSPNRFDQLLGTAAAAASSLTATATTQGRRLPTAIRHVSHLDSRRGCLIETVQPGRFGSTTRHCVIYRPGFLAALHQDASKINRFAPTIDYIVKKIISSSSASAAAKKLDLSRISEIQYYAYVVCHRGFLYCTVGGGAIIILVVGRNRHVIEEATTIHKFPLSPDLAGASLFLLSPHFIPLRHVEDPRVCFERFCKERQVDLHHPKLSFAQFVLEHE